jgi:hypothetical protein
LRGKIAFVYLSCRFLQRATTTLYKRRGKASRKGNGLGETIRRQAACGCPYQTRDLHRLDGGRSQERLEASDIEWEKYALDGQPVPLMGERKPDTCPFTNGAFDADFATVSFHELLGD